MKTFTNISKSLLLSLVMVMGAYFVQAQDEEESTPLSVSGSIDTYYRLNLNSTNDATNGGTTAPGSSFANLPGFSLGMANVVLGMDGEKTGFVADLVFGPRGTDAVFGSPIDAWKVVNQLYGYWNVSDNLTLTLGNFNTFLGYEVISPTANFNYSTSYMFSYGPFSHSGIKADITAGDVSLMFGLFNPTDATDFNPDNTYLGGAQIGYGGAYLNFLFDDDFFQVDLTAGWDLTETFYLGVNATSASDSFFGAALYLQNSFSDDFSMGLRGEYFNQNQPDGTLPDDLLVLSTPDASVIDLTLSANYAVGDLTFIPEFRVDIFSEDEVVPDAAETDVEGSLASFVLAAVYAF